MDVYLLYVCAYTSSRTSMISRVRLVDHDSYSYHYHYHYHYNLLLLPLPLPSYLVDRLDQVEER